jgi:hypothetical protein
MPGVGEWGSVLVGFDEDLGAVAADDREEGILTGFLKSGLEAKLIAIKGDGLNYAADDEKRGDCLNGGWWHWVWTSCRGQSSG